MKAFLSTLKGKIIAGAAGAVVIGTGIILAVVISGLSDIVTQKNLDKSKEIDSNKND